MYQVSWHFIVQAGFQRPEHLASFYNLFIKHFKPPNKFTVELPLILFAQFKCPWTRMQYTNTIVYM